MTYDRIEVRPIARALGAEVHGVDLSAPLADAVFAEIHRAFLEHLVIFFRDQDLTPDRQVAFARRFGPIGTYPFAEPIEGHPEVIAVVKEPEQTTNFGGFWHSDTAYLERPPLGSVLYARQVPPLGGDTLFANMVLAYERLSDGMKALLDGLVALNSSAKNTAAVRGTHLRSGTMAGKDLERMDIEAAHPVVRTHPQTGRKALYVNRAHTLRFRGMTEAESAPLLAFLFDHAVKEEFTCRFRWDRGSLAVWDNRCTQHYALNDYPGQRRVMHRVTVEGEIPY
ncbi:MAG: TauD/TfdA dioxygenase family protein [Kiloniellaceae bacterium]